MSYDDQDLKETAYEIYLERKARGDPNADNQEENWHKARERLVQINILQRGEVE